MKLLLSLLVVANLLAFAWLQGWLAPLAGDGRDPGRADQQVNAGELRVVPASRPATAPGTAASLPGTAASSTGAAPAQSPSPGAAVGPAPAAAPAPAPAAGPGNAVPAPPAPAAPPAVAPAPAAAPPPAPAASGPAPATAAPDSPAASLRGASCVEIGPLPEGDALRVQAMVDAAMPGLLMDVRRLEEVTSYWVYLPPSPTMADAQRRIAELKQLGIAEYYLMPDGPFRGAISLGLFRQDDLAFALQRSLAERGVRGARVAPRGPGTSKMTLRVRPVTSELPAELARIRATYPEAVARPCPN